MVLVQQLNEDVSVGVSEGKIEVDFPYYKYDIEIHMGVVILKRRA